MYKWCKTYHSAQFRSEFDTCFQLREILHVVGFNEILQLEWHVLVCKRFKFDVWWHNALSNLHDNQYRNGIILNTVYFVFNSMCYIPSNELHVENELLMLIYTSTILTLHYQCSKWCRPVILHNQCVVLCNWICFKCKCAMYWKDVMHSCY